MTPKSERTLRLELRLEQNRMLTPEQKGLHYTVRHTQHGCADICNDCKRPVPRLMQYIHTEKHGYEL